jgi:hypothetical protein
MPEWMRISIAEAAVRRLPWFAACMLAPGGGGALGLLLSTREVPRATWPEAARVVALAEFGTAAEVQPGTDSAQGAAADSPPPPEDTAERLKRAAETRSPAQPPPRRTRAEQDDPALAAGVFLRPG